VGCGERRSNEVTGGREGRRQRGGGEGGARGEGRRFRERTMLVGKSEREQSKRWGGRGGELVEKEEIEREGRNGNR